MKKLFILIVILSLTFVLTSCNSEPTVRELTRDEYKEIEDEITNEIQEKYDRDLQIAKDNLQPELIYLEGKEIIEKEVIVEVLIPMDAEDIQKIKDDLKIESDIQLQYAISNLEKEEIEVEKIVYVDRDMPIEGEDYEFGFDVCVTFVNDGDNFFHLKGLIKPTLIGTLFGANYNIELEEANSTGATEYAFKNEDAYTVCYRSFGDKIDGFDNLYPNWIPIEAPNKNE